MTTNESVQKKNLDKLEGFLGFLGVILVLSMQLAWDYVSDWTNLSGNFSELTRALSILYYFGCIILLVSIVAFYSNLYSGNTKKAEEIGNTLMKIFWIPLVLTVAPMIDYLIFNHSSNDWVVEFVYIVGSLFYFLVIIYIIVTTLLMRNPKIDEEILKEECDKETSVKQHTEPKK